MVNFSLLTITDVEAASAAEVVAPLAGTVHEAVHLPVGEHAR